jgi:electron transfer flavoprotein alpha subunit
METMLFLAHTDPDGGLPGAALEALGAALDLAAALGGVRVHGGLVGGDVQGGGNAMAGAGFARMLGVGGDVFREARYATDSLAAEAVCRASGASLVVAPATSRWARVLPGVACRLGGRSDTHVTALEADPGGVVVSRSFYRQRMEARLRRAERPWVLLVDPGSHRRWAGEAGTAAVESVPVALEEAGVRTRVLGFEAPPADQQTIRPDASLLFVAGAGWTKRQADGQSHAAEAEALILDFLRRTQASLGGSKSLVDLSGEGHAVLPFMSYLNQVGQTGASPRHPKGLATCCHGEEPHVVGWRFVSERRAVNLDPNCGWARGKADVVYVADAFAVLARVNELLSA